MPNLRHTNEVIGAYVTVGARIHLYRFLDRLQENAIYCNMDSFIFIQPSGEPWPISTGDKLGNMHSKMNTLEHIYEFASGGQTSMHKGWSRMKARKLYGNSRASIYKLSRLKIGEFRGNQNYRFRTRRTLC